MHNHNRPVFGQPGDMEIKFATFVSIQSTDGAVKGMQIELCSFMHLFFSDCTANQRVAINIEVGTNGVVKWSRICGISLKTPRRINNDAIIRCTEVGTQGKIGLMTVSLCESYTYNVVVSVHDLNCANTNISHTDITTHDCAFCIGSTATGTQLISFFTMVDAKGTINHLALNKPTTVSNANIVENTGSGNVLVHSPDASHFENCVFKDNTPTSFSRSKVTFFGCMFDRTPVNANAGGWVVKTEPVLNVMNMFSHEWCWYPFSIIPSPKRQFVFILCQNLLLTTS